MTPGPVAVWVGTRADLFPLGPVLEALGRSADLDTFVVASPAIGALLDEIDVSGVEICRLAAGLGADDRHAPALSGPGIAAEFTSLLIRRRPKALVVLGDRWELLYVVPPAVLLGVAVIHLHGGEVTEGAIDDRVRHAVSKLADLHCVSTNGSARRLGQLGEALDRIVVTGAPSLDRLAGVSRLSDGDLAGLLGGEVVRPLALATYHPATASEEDPGATTDAMLDALLETAGTTVLTHPGSDVGRDGILERVQARASDRSLRVVPTLGAHYPVVMAGCDVVVGNSSSGIIEAASFSVPVVDIGARQAGRERGANVLTVAPDREAIADGVRRALDPHFRDVARGAVNPYGDGHAADRIVSVVRRAVHGVPARKAFVDAGTGAG